MKIFGCWRAGLASTPNWSTIIWKSKAKPKMSRVENILEDYNSLIREGHVFNNGDLNGYLRVVTVDPEVSLRALVQSGRQRNFGKKVLAPKSVNQRRYLEAIERNDMVFGVGPAGTGKTYLAVA